MPYDAEKVEMTRATRLTLIKRIQERRNSKILVYITGDRRLFETKIAFDAMPFFHQHLSSFGNIPKLDLFIYSTGGQTMAAYSLVNTIREFTDKFGLIAPYKAYSAATLMALGADEIVMTRIGQLSPIDPSVETPFAPLIPMPGTPGSGRLVPVSVEDVAGYFDMVRQELKLKDEDSIIRAFERLTNAVHPLALGAVNRSRDQIGFLARRLLNQHRSDTTQIEAIVEALTRERYSHDYTISRKEAKNELKLNIVDMDSELEGLVLGLYHEYEKLVKINEPFHPDMVLKEKDEGSTEFVRAIVESEAMTHAFCTSRSYKKVKTHEAPFVDYMEKTTSEGWSIKNDL